MTDISRLPSVMFWIWLHLLQFDVSNQTQKPEEDEMNKRDRPLPSKRISLRNALILRWALVPACLGLSAVYSVQTLYASIALVTLTIIYDDLRASARGWIVRNVVNACGFASFEVGSTLVAGIFYY
jgi:4-hydroxybenzoate polyprenyltransferase